MRSLNPNPTSLSRPFHYNERGVAGVQVSGLGIEGIISMRTPLGLTQSVLIKGVPLFQELFSICKVRSGPLAVSALQWMSVCRVSARRGSTVFVLGVRMRI